MYTHGMFIESKDLLNYTVSKPVFSKLGFKQLNRSKNRKDFLFAFFASSTAR